MRERAGEIMRERGIQRERYNEQERGGGRKIQRERYNERERERYKERERERGTVGQTDRQIDVKVDGPVRPRNGPVTSPFFDPSVKTHNGPIIFIIYTGPF